MIRFALATGLVLGGFVAGVGAMLIALDRLIGDRAPTLAAGHRRALDEDWWTG